MNYIEELFARQGALLRAVSRVGSRRRAEESREGEKSPSTAAEVWELAEETAPFSAEDGPILGKSGANREEIPEMAASRGRTEEEGAAETVRTEVRTGEGWAVTGESVRELSERCERDARRYDGGFPLY